MKKFIEKYSFIVSIVIILGIITLSSIFLFYSLKKLYISENKNLILKKLNQTENILFEQYFQNKQILISSKRFNKFFFEAEKINPDSSKLITIKAKKKNETFYKTFKLPPVKIKNQLIPDLNSFVDKQLYINNVFCEIWQKSGDNFVRIATGKSTEKNKYIFINSDEEPAKSVLSGNDFEESIQTESNLKFISSFPVYNNGKIEFFISLENNKNILSSVALLFQNDTNRMLIINSNGNIISRSANNNSVPEKLNFTKNISQISDKTYLKNINNNLLYFRFLPELSIYIGYLQNNSSVDSIFIKYKQIILLTAIILALISIFFLFVIKYRNKQKRLNLINKFREFLPENNKNHNSFEDIINFLRRYYSDISKIIKDIASGKYESKIPEEYNTELFNNIGKIQDEFQKTKQVETIQISERKLKEIFDKSAAQISEILQYASAVEDLSYKIIKHISEFIGAEQVALFIVDEDLQKNKSLKMTASYAYSKQRNAHKELSVNEGLVGRAYLEKKSVFLTEIPDNYTFIESGFGFQKPNCLLIIPLIFNNDVQALIELGSIKIIDENQIKFLENIGENIASTIANLKHSKQTEILLKQTTEQSKEIEEQRKTLEEKINTHRKQNRNLDKQILQLIEIIDSIKSVSYLIEYDLKGNIMDVSSKVINLFEARKEDFISKSHKEIIKTDNYSQDYQNFWDELAANKTQYIKETIYVGNKEITMKQTYVPIRNVRRKIYRFLSIGTIQE